MSVDSKLIGGPMSVSHETKLTRLWSNLSQKRIQKKIHLCGLFNLLTLHFKKITLAYLLIKMKFNSQIFCTIPVQRI